MIAAHSGPRKETVESVSNAAPTEAENAEAVVVSNSEASNANMPAASTPMSGSEGIDHKHSPSSINLLGLPWNTLDACSSVIFRWDFLTRVYARDDVCDFSCIFAFSLLFLGILCVR